MVRLMCFPAAVLHSPVPKRCITFLLPERMLQMSANESCENNLWPKLLLAGWRKKSSAVWGFCVTGGLNNLRGAPQLGHLWFVWFACDPEGLAVAPDGCGRCGRAPNDTPSVILTVDSSPSDAAALVVKLYGCFCVYQPFSCGQVQLIHTQHLTSDASECRDNHFSA